jgi:hypothetical protein
MDHKTADHLFPKKAESAITPFIRQGCTSRHIHHYHRNWIVTFLETQQDSPTRPTQPHQGHKTKQIQEGSNIMAEQRAHPCKSQRMEHECRKARIRQGIAAFLTTIIITMIILNTGTRNTAVREQGTPKQQLQTDQSTCRRTKDQPEETHKQYNRDNSRSMDNERKETAKTEQTSIINHNRQSKDKYSGTFLIG